MLQDKLISNSPEEYLRRVKRTNIYRWVVFSSFFIVIVGSANAFYITKMVSLDTFKEYRALFDILFLARGVTKILTDALMFTLFFKTFSFFVSIKRSIIKETSGEQEDLTTYNKLVICATLFLSILNIGSSLIVSVVLSLYQSSIVKDSPTLSQNMAFRILIQPVNWTINFLTICGLLYLFHF